MITRIILALLLATTAAGCNTSSTTGPPKTLTISDAEVFTMARASVTESMIDPDSTRISELRRINSNNMDLVCGSVNSRNRFGGYTGKKPFAYSVERNQTAVLGEGDLLTANIWVTICMTST